MSGRNSKVTEVTEDYTASETQSVFVESIDSLKPKKLLLRHFTKEKVSQLCINYLRAMSNCICHDFFKFQGFMNFS